jgi:hypothetical protein
MPSGLRFVTWEDRAAAVRLGGHARRGGWRYSGSDLHHACKTAGLGLEAAEPRLVVRRFVGADQRQRPQPDIAAASWTLFMNDFAAPLSGSSAIAASA